MFSVTSLVTLNQIATDSKMKSIHLALYAHGIWMRCQHGRCRLTTTPTQSVWFLHLDDLADRIKIVIAGVLIVRKCSFIL